VPRRYYSSTAIATSLTAQLSASATSMTVDAATFTGYPASYPYTLIIDEGLSTEEVVEISSAAGTTLTIATRGVDSTTPQIHLNGASVKLGVSARDFNEANLHVYLDGQTATKHSGVHGLAGEVVGTTDSQTLTNKTLTSPTITGGSVNPTTLQRSGANAVVVSASMTANGVTYATDLSLVRSTAAGTTGQVLKATTSSAPTWGSLDLSAAATVGSSILPVANGGTNASTASAARTSLSAAASGSNSDITALTGLPSWTSYTPTWTTSGTAPSLGNGTLTGGYLAIGKILFFRIQFQPGSTTTFGSGGYSFALPPGFTAVASAQQTVSGSFNSAGNVYAAVGLISASGTTISRVRYNNGFLTGSAPGTMTSADFVALTGMIEVQ